MWSMSAPIWPIPGQPWLKLVDIGPTSVKFEQQPGRFRVLEKIGRSRPKFDGDRSRVGPILTEAGFERGGLSKLAPDSADSIDLHPKKRSSAYLIPERFWTNTQRPLPTWDHSASGRRKDTGATFPEKGPISVGIAKLRSTPLQIWPNRGQFWPKSPQKLARRRPRIRAEVTRSRFVNKVVDDARPNAPPTGRPADRPTVDQPSTARGPDRLTDRTSAGAHDHARGSARSLTSFKPMSSRNLVSKSNSSASGAGDTDKDFTSSH